MSTGTAFDMAMARELLLNESVHLCDNSLALFIHEHHQVAPLGVELNLLPAQLLFVGLLLLCNLCLVAAPQLCKTREMRNKEMSEEVT